MWKEITLGSFQPICQGDLRDFLSENGFYVDGDVLHGRENFEYNY